MAHVPETRQTPLPPELGGAPQHKTVQVNPPENVVYEPVGFAVAKGPEGAVEVQFLISPFKMVTVAMTGEEKKALVQKLTGGVVIA